MFCSECGAKAAGKFCSECGHRLRAAEPGVETEFDPSVVLVIDWSDMIDYEQLVAVPAVRERIARAAAQARRRMTGEEFLEMYGKALGKLSGVPLPMTALAHFAQSAGAKLGIRTGKSGQRALGLPVGEAVVRVLCHLARNGSAVRGVQQLLDGCVVKAALPSDLLALEGELVIAVGRSLQGSVVEARTEIAGQLFDWGKSTRFLEEMFATLSAPAAA